MLTLPVYRKLFREHPEAKKMFRSEGSGPMKGSLLALTIEAIGAYRGQGTTKLVTTLAIILLVIKRRMSLRSGSRWPASFAYAPCGPSVWMQQYFSTLPGIGATHLAHL
jgi:hypothetical protein